MPVNKEQYLQISTELKKRNVILVAVSKTKTVADILSLYELGQRDFGENYVQELVDKHQQLPKDIRWHFIGHLQSNKVKYISTVVSLIHSIDSFKLLKEVDKQGMKSKTAIDVLLQVHIAQEETKFGMDENELKDLLNSLSDLKHIRVKGLMGMASFSIDEDRIHQEFLYLKSLYDRYHSMSSAYCQMSVLSMGMSSDYAAAVEAGSNMVRIGSLIFGERTSV